MGFSTRWLLRFLPIVLIAVLFVAVATDSGEVRYAAPMPIASHRAEVCTWACHNHGCRHHPRLPTWLTSDVGLYGATIRGLGTLGGHTRIGYDLANLLIFCAIWPVSTYLLWWKVMDQRLRIAALTRAADRL
jgi:hypothetical protein